MIKRTEIPIIGVNMEGFEASVSSSTLSVGAGIFTNNLIDIPVVTAFEPFEFDIEGDEELLVAYDIFLIEGGSKVVVERTEVTEHTVPFYTGDEPLAHTLSSIRLPAGKTIDEIDVEMRILKEKEAIPNEDKS